MVSNFPDIEKAAISLPITGKNRAIAHNFAAQHMLKQKAEEVFYNTLAVLTVNSYLEMLGVSTDLTHSDSWNPVMRACNNVADLNLTSLGKLECRPLKNPDTGCYIPMEVWNLRLGYVIVRIDDSLKQASLLGFLPQVTTEDLALTNLRPIEALIDRLHDERAFMANLVENSSLVNLKQWFEHVFTAGWETVESLLNPEQLATAWGFRNGEISTEKFTDAEEVHHSIQRAKLIDLAIQLGDRQVVLLIEITPEKTGSIAVSLQVHPQSRDIYLPETLILRVIESSGAVFMQAQARSQDNFIQLQFSAQPQERFTVQIVLDQAELTEQFQL